MPRKPAHQQPDTLKLIHDHAFVLFGRHGYEGVSIGDIAKATGLSKGALSACFETAALPDQETPLARGAFLF